MMLHLLSQRPSVNRVGLELALEPVNDSPEELMRVSELYALSEADLQQHLQASGVGISQIRNARKIFPALAVTAGLVDVRPPSHTYSIAARGQALLTTSQVTHHPPATATSASVVPEATRRAVERALRSMSPETIGAALGAESAATQSEEAQKAARARLAERQRDHQRTVQQLVQLFSDGTFSENPVDLAWWTSDLATPLVICEVKTIRGSDAHAQIRHAFGQVFYYEQFFGIATAAGRAIMLVVATDHDVEDSLGEFLDRHDVALITVTEGSWTVRNKAAALLRPFLKVPPSG
jgi:hypothetical protein